MLANNQGIQGQSLDCLGPTLPGGGGHILGRLPPISRSTFLGVLQQVSVMPCAPCCCNEIQENRINFLKVRQQIRFFIPWPWHCTWVQSARFSSIGVSPKSNPASCAWLGIAWALEIDLFSNYDKVLGLAGEIVCICRQVRST